MKNAVCLSLTLLIIGCVTNPSRPTSLPLSIFPTAPWEDAMITLQQINVMFQSIREETNWNIDGDMLWSYFFFDNDQEKLNSLAKELSTFGYKVADLSRTKDNSSYVLRIEKVETHTPESLFERNLQFYALAKKYGIKSYEGMDVGPVLK